MYPVLVPAAMVELQKCVCNDTYCVHAHEENYGSK